MNLYDYSQRGNWFKSIDVLAVFDAPPPQNGEYGLWSSEEILPRSERSVPDWHTARDVIRR